MKLRSAQSCLIKNSVFLLCIFGLAFYIRDILISIFTYNIQINTIILTTIIIGIILTYLRVVLYEREYAKLSAFNTLKSGEIAKLKIIKPIFMYMNKSSKVLSQTNMQTILGSIEKKIEDYSSLPKYISGILIFLGLLGTFWGLSHTIGNVASIIDTLGVGGKDAAASFVQLKNSLKIPLTGMGIAFGCSLFGLSGSLLMGFLIVNMRKTSDDLLNAVEVWLNTNTVDINTNVENEGYHGNTFTLALMEKTIETIYAFQAQLNQLENDRVSIIELQANMSKEIAKVCDAVSFQQDSLKKLTQNQSDSNSRIIGELTTKLDSIDITLKHIYQESVNGKKTIIQSLGNDIRTVSKVLSSLIQE